ncbi:hypothetical protein C8R41DRAFT_914430 [Lentinula lateritia]|uniref:Uncharacterized protein n=1 Tax=Lentinula lateritia TaxID=40482 RepID=A0ABQ8W0D5_9AGAR|nr:hypothetical protein C8R41DRAFT_914430 [Lentinula lateritia]
MALSRTSLASASLANNHAVLIPVCPFRYFARRVPSTLFLISPPVSQISSCTLLLVKERSIDHGSSPFITAININLSSMETPLGYLAVAMQLLDLGWTWLDVQDFIVGTCIINQVKAIRKQRSNGSTSSLGCTN